MINVIELWGIQSGKTSIIRGTLEHLHARNIPVLHVVDNRRHVWYLTNRPKFPVQYPLISVAEFLEYRSSARAIALDVSHDNLRTDGDGSSLVSVARDRLSVYAGPTQLFIAHNP